MEQESPQLEAHDNQTNISDTNERGFSGDFHIQESKKEKEKCCSLFVRLGINFVRDLKCHLFIYARPSPQRSLSTFILISQIFTGNVGRTLNLITYLLIGNIANCSYFDPLW